MKHLKQASTYVAQCINKATDEDAPPLLQIATNETNLKRVLTSWSEF